MKNVDHKRVQKISWVLKEESTISEYMAFQRRDDIFLNEGQKLVLESFYFNKIGHLDQKLYLFYFDQPLFNKIQSIFFSGKNL